MVCKKCLEELTATNIYPSDHRYCKTCGIKHTAYLSERRQTLTSLREMNLESKIIQTKYLIKCAVMEFGLDKVYISYSGGKDSTVLSHIAKSMYPDILHLFCTYLQIQQMNILKPLSIFNGKKKKMLQTLSLSSLRIFMVKYGHLKK